MGAYGVPEPPTQLLLQAPLRGRLSLKQAFWVLVTVPSHVRALDWGRGTPSRGQQGGFNGRSSPYSLYSQTLGNGKWKLPPAKLTHCCRTQNGCGGGWGQDRQPREPISGKLAGAEGRWLRPQFPQDPNPEMWAPWVAERGPYRMMSSDFTLCSTASQGTSPQSCLHC